MSLRFKEALGRHYEDPASDSSWAPHEVKDLDSNQGSHIRPGKLKSAVIGGKIADLDNYFQLGAVLSEADTLKHEIALLLSRVEGLNNQSVGYLQQIEKGVDKRREADLRAEMATLKTMRDIVGGQIAEKQARVDELAKNPPAAPVVPAAPEAPVAAPEVSPEAPEVSPEAPVAAPAPEAPVAAPVAPVAPVAMEAPPATPGGTIGVGFGTPAPVVVPPALQ